jgi:AcrR family transcriptional regulator
VPQVDASASPDPRFARTRAAVRAAVRELVDRDGIEGVTHQRVAEVAGVGRASVYRHWPDRTHLLLDALAGVGDPASWRSSGDLATDLRRELGRVQRILNESPFVAQLVALIGRAEWEPELRTLKRQLLAQGTGGLRQALEHGVSRGELRADLDVDATMARLAGPLFFQRLLADTTIEDGFVTALIEDLREWWR